MLGRKYIHRYRFIFFLIFMTLLGGFAKAESPSVLHLKNARVFDSKNAVLQQSQDVLVEGNRIKAVGIGLAVPSGASAIDAEGRVLLPGLIEAHGHLMLHENPIKLLTSMDLTEQGARGLVRARDYLELGFTTMRDAGGHTYGIKKVIDAGVAPGPRVYPSGATIGQTSGHGDMRFANEGAGYWEDPKNKSYAERSGVSIIADGSDAVRKAVREVLFYGASQIKVHAGGGVTTLSDPLEATQYTLDEMKAAVEEAERYGTYVLVHAHTDDAINNAIEAGVKSIDHGMLIKEKTMKRIAREGIFLSPQAYITLSDPEANPAIQDPVQIAKLKRVKAGAENELKWAKKYKVKVLWGTDIFGDGPFFKTMVREWEFRAPYFSATEQLQQATWNNAQMLKLSGLKNPYSEAALGVIEPGAYADLILVEGEPTQDIKVMMNPKDNFKLIIKDGVVFKNTLGD